MTITALAVTTLHFMQISPLFVTLPRMEDQPSCQDSILLQNTIEGISRKINKYKLTPLEYSHPLRKPGTPTTNQIDKKGLIPRPYLHQNWQARFTNTVGSGESI